MYELITETSPFKEYKGSYKLFKDTKNGVKNNHDCIEIKRLQQIITNQIEK